MSNAIINLSRIIDPSEMKLFLGPTDNVVRIDFINHPIFKIMKENSEGNTWFSKELDYGSDRIRFNELDDVAKRMFQLNIGYQTIMDSGASNGYLESLVPITTDPILKILYSRIGVEELIHGESYTYALNQILGSKATEFINEIYKDPIIRRRMDNEVDAFSDLDEVVGSISQGTLEPTDDVVKKSILTTLVQTYLLEGIKFPFSFFVSFTINKSYNNAIQNVARLLKLIAHDEFNTHIPTHLHVLKILRENEHEGFSHLFTNGWFNELVVNTTKLVVDQELEWNKYLLRDGAIPGYTEAIGDHFIKYFADLRLQGLKLDPIYEVESNDIIKWYNNYKNLNLQNVALQEASNTNYIKGGLTNDLNWG
jgi:ribonucleoside-diphosphate reductase beta chain